MSRDSARAVIEEDEGRFSLMHVDGLLQMVNEPDLEPRVPKSRSEMAGLCALDLERYDDQRAIDHANIGPIRTSGVIQLQEQLDLIVGSNRQKGGVAKPGALLDAYPGIGKSTAVQDWARRYHLAQVRLRGETTAQGHRRIPVIYIGITGNTQIRGLNQAICRFYGLPQSGNADELAERALKSVLKLRTMVFIVEDIHFLANAGSNKPKMVNQLKYLANTFPVTFIYTGVGVLGLGILEEGSARAAELLNAQFGRRTSLLALERFDIKTDRGRDEFRRLLLTIEQKLVLADKHKGMLADDLAGYLYARSSGHFASLMSLIRGGCYLAIATKHERLDEDLLDRVTIDAAAEAQRRELLAQLEDGLVSATPVKRTRRRAA